MTRRKKRWSGPASAWPNEPERGRRAGVGPALRVVVSVVNLLGRLAVEPMEILPTLKATQA